MDKIITDKACLLNWSKDRSYLNLHKLEVTLSSGKIITTYEVVSRWSAGSYGSGGLITESMKGVVFTESELNFI